MPYLVHTSCSVGRPLHLCISLSLSPYLSKIREPKHLYDLILWNPFHCHESGLSDPTDDNARPSCHSTQPLRLVERLHIPDITCRAPEELDITEAGAKKTEPRNPWASTRRILNTQCVSSSPSRRLLSRARQAARCHGRMHIHSVIDRYKISIWTPRQASSILKKSHVRLPPSAY